MPLSRQKNKNRLPESLAAKARANKTNPRIQAQKPRRSLSPGKQRRTESPNKQRHGTPSKRQLQPQAHSSSRRASSSPPRAKKSPRSPSKGRGRAEPPARTSSAHRSPKRDGRQPSPTRERGRSSSNRMMEPEEGSIIQIKKKEQAAKKRAARAKKKGAKKKSSSSSKPKQEQDEPAPPSPEKNPVPVPVICLAPNPNPNGGENGAYPEDGTAGVSLIKSWPDDATDPGAHAFNDTKNGPQQAPAPGAAGPSSPQPAPGVSSAAHAAVSPQPPVHGVTPVWSEQPPSHAVNPAPQLPPKVSAAAAWSAAPIWSAPAPGQLSPDQPAPARSSREPSPVVWSAHNEVTSAAMNSAPQQGPTTGVWSVSMMQRGPEAYPAPSPNVHPSSMPAYNDIPDYNNSSGASLKKSWMDTSEQHQANMPAYANMPPYPDGRPGVPMKKSSDANPANMSPYDNGASKKSPWVEGSGTQLPPSPDDQNGGSMKDASWVEATDKPHGSLPPYPESRAGSPTKKKIWDKSDNNASNTNVPPNTSMPTYSENNTGVSMKKSWVEVDATSALPGFPETRSSVSNLKKSWVDVEESDMSAVIVGVSQGNSFQVSVDPSTRATLAAASSRVSVARSTHSRASFVSGRSRVSVGQSTISGGMSTVSGPVAKRVSVSAPGVRRDPPGVARKAPNDDASVAIKPKLVPGQKPQPRLKSIVRPDLEMFKQPEPPKPSAFESLLKGVGRCGGADTSEPDPIRPCDIPRGSERRIDMSKAPEANVSRGVTGEFLSAGYWFS